MLICCLPTDAPYIPDHVVDRGCDTPVESYFFQTKFDEDKLYIKMICFQEIYAFVVDKFFIWNLLDLANFGWSSNIWIS
jgi:hypothetical protein